MGIYDAQNKCPCCSGSGVQYNRKTGLRQLCPCCHGTVKIKREGKIYA